MNAGVPPLRIPVLIGAPFYCVVGTPIAHSKSPLIHRLFAEQFGRALQYERIEVARGALGEALAELRRLGCLGVNVTVPHKEAACELACCRSAGAALAGAANTLSWDSSGRLHADNTDGIGLARDLARQRGTKLAGQRVLLLGAGGAVAGVLGALLAEQPASVAIANRTPARAEGLAQRFATTGAVQVVAPLQPFSRPFDCIVNGTSASLTGDVPALDLSAVGAGTFCYDMFYAKTETSFMRWAREAGAGRVSDGRGMLVEQAAAAFHLWHGVRPAVEPVLAALRQ